jgi:hypothetical protein
MNPPMSQLIEIAEVATTAVTAAVAAFHLGLYRIELVMAVYFSVALAGQMVVSTLARMSRAPGPGTLE